MAFLKFLQGHFLKYLELELAVVGLVVVVLQLVVGFAAVVAELAVVVDNDVDAVLVVVVVGNLYSVSLVFGFQCGLGLTCTGLAKSCRSMRGEETFGERRLLVIHVWS